MTSISARHIILTPTQPVGSGRPQRESNPGRERKREREEEREGERVMIWEKLVYGYN